MASCDQASTRKALYKIGTWGGLDVVCVPIAIGQPDLEPMIVKPDGSWRSYREVSCHTDPRRIQASAMELVDFRACEIVDLQREEGGDE